MIPGRFRGGATRRELPQARSAIVANGRDYGEQPREALEAISFGAAQVLRDGWPEVARP
jgi:hypothetical protein